MRWRCAPLGAVSWQAETCVYGYEMTATGLAPEIWWFGSGGPYVKPADAFSLLRPETAESLFYLWRATRDER